MPRLQNKQRANGCGRLRAMRSPLVVALLSLGLFACPDPVPGACKEDEDCKSGEACCDGLCRNVETDSTNCGGCNVVCEFPNTTPSCSAGRCQLNCKQGFGNCNNEREDGCEYVTANDVNNCGVCNKVCTSTNAVPVCEMSRCKTGACDLHWANCNDDDIDGCEIDTRVTLNHCGECGNACSLPHATARCESSACEVASCQMNWGNCDGQPENGCERDFTSDALHCGGCNKACGPGQQCVASLCRANELIVFGGRESFVGSVVSREATKYDLTTHSFVALAPATPNGNIPPRQQHIAAYDLPRNRMVVWGGADGLGTPVPNDTWALDFSVVPPAWRKLTTTGTAPTARFGAAAAVDTQAWKLYVFGGVLEDGSTYGDPLSDLFVLDLATLAWSQVHPSNADGGPGDRFNARAAFDPVEKKVLLYGGNHGVIRTDLSELWQFDPATQAWIPSVLPPFPTGWADARAMTALFGGHPAYVYSGVTNILQDTGVMRTVLPDLQAIDVTQSQPWTELERFDPRPKPRARYSATHVERDGLLYLYAGGEVDTDGFRTLPDMWRYTPDGGAWSMVNDGGVGAPGARLSSTMIAR